MEAPKGLRKSHQWNKDKGAIACIECGGELVEGDEVYTDCAVTLHVACLADYLKGDSHEWRMDTP